MNTVLTSIALRQILVATDFSEMSDVALSYAIGVAERYGSNVHVANISDPKEESVERWDHETGVQTHLDELEGRLKQFPHRIELLCGNVCEELERIIVANKIDLLVVGTRGCKGIERVISGSMAEQIFRQSPCPVLTVGPNVAELLALPMELREVVFTTDFTKESLAALDFAISFTQETQANLTLVHVAGPNAQHTAQEVSAATILKLDRLRNLLPNRLAFRQKPECVVAFGPPAERVLEIAFERMAGLIVMGVRSPVMNPALETHLPWGFARKIVSGAHCPVLTVSN